MQQLLLLHWYILHMREKMIHRVLGHWLLEMRDKHWIIIAVGYVWWNLEPIMASQKRGENRVCNLLRAERRRREFLFCEPLGGLIRVWHGGISLPRWVTAYGNLMFAEDVWLGLEIQWDSQCKQQCSCYGQWKQEDQSIKSKPSAGSPCRVLQVEARLLDWIN